ncbi:MAG: hypothetical protein M4579_005353 [Chaenotheca gracillima]|nr:MAG: hypothetical protein M4579_005353 [Chaenotheca gracillima]
MVFYPPSWTPKVPRDVPDSIPISEFMFNELEGRHPLGYSHPPFTCGLSGTSYSALEVKDRIEHLARALAKEFDWQPNEGTEWDKVIGIFAFNTAWAHLNFHRLSGIASPANAAYSAPELAFQLKSSGSKALFTCAPLLPTALEAAKEAGIPPNRVYLLELPKELTGDLPTSIKNKTVNQFIREGAELPRLEKLQWEAGQGARQTAFLCYSSGTSGLPKGVMISHRNVIGNTLQVAAYESPTRKNDDLKVVLGFLPQSHIYSLVVICHADTYRGYGVVVLPKYDFHPMLKAIEHYRINVLYLVPPVVIGMVNNKSALEKYDLSSVDSIFTGAAPLGLETAGDLQKIFPTWLIRQGYGLTETSTIVSSTSTTDIWLGSCGSFISGVEARLVSMEGVDIEGYDQPGELLVRSPSVVLGYLNNEKANTETFQDGWMRTGDEAVVRKSPNGHEHVFIVDRIKELIKVKGLQVAPAELEAHILAHPAVADVAVIPVHDDAAGELPKAFVVKSASVGLEDNDRLLKREIEKHVESQKSRHKWLKGGVEFIDVIPKSPSGKILRRLLRDKERESRRKAGAKL